MKIKVNGFIFCIVDVDFIYVVFYFIIGVCCVMLVIYGINIEDVDVWIFFIVKFVRLLINEDVIMIF